MAYTPPLSNAVNFDGAADAYTPPLSNAVNFNDLPPSQIDVTGIASEEAFGSASVKAQVDSSGVATEEAFGSHILGPFVVTTGVASGQAFGLATITEGDTIVAIGIADESALGTPSITYTAPAAEVVETEEAPAGGTYASVRQRTEAYAMRADAKGQNIRISQRITAKPEMVVEQINERDRQDLLDIFTVFRETRKAA